MKSGFTKARAVLILAAALLPIGAQARVIAEFHGNDAIVGLSDTTGPACGIQGSGWRNAYFLQYGRSPIIRGCWRHRTAKETLLRPTALVICPMTKDGKLEACTFALAEDFVDRDSLPQPAKLP